jgi:hypothetical protein
MCGKKFPENAAGVYQHQPYLSSPISARRAGILFIEDIFRAIQRNRFPNCFPARESRTAAAGQFFETQRASKARLDYFIVCVRAHRIKHKHSLLLTNFAAFSPNTKSFSLL